MRFLERKLKGPEADEFKRWLVTVAHRVAEAANEGGLFGFGGERVSEAEKKRHSTNRLRLRPTGELICVAVV
jgi:hypothetical protein